MSESVQELESLLHDQPKNPLRPNQIKDYQEEADRLRGIATAPAWQAGADRGAATRRYRHLNQMIQEQAPKPVEPERASKIYKLANEVLETQIKPALLPRTHMRRNPAGAVDHFIRRENSKPVKGAILTWKRAMRALDPSNEETDFTNIERFRPEGVNPDGTSTYMADAQIPGVFAMSPQAKSNWPLGEAQVDTPLKQAQKRERTEAEIQATNARLANARAIKAEKEAAAKAAQSAAAQDVPAAEA